MVTFILASKSRAIIWTTFCVYIHHDWLVGALHDIFLFKIVATSFRLYAGSIARAIVIHKLLLGHLPISIIDKGLLELVRIGLGSPVPRARSDYLQHMTYTQIWVIHSVFACQKHSPTADLNRWRILGTGPKARQNCVVQDERHKPLAPVVVGPGRGSSLYATQTSNRSRFCVTAVGDQVVLRYLGFPCTPPKHQIGLVFALCLLETV